MSARTQKLHELAKSAKELVEKVKSHEGQGFDRSEIHGKIVLDHWRSGYRVTQDGQETGESLTLEQVNERKPEEENEVRYEVIDGVGNFNSDGSFVVDAFWSKSRAFWTTPNELGEKHVQWERLLKQDWLIEGRRDGSTVYKIGSTRFHESAQGAITELGSEPSIGERIFGESWKH